MGGYTEAQGACRKVENMNESQDKTEEVKKKEKTPKEIREEKTIEQRRKFPDRFSMKKIGDEFFIVKNSCKNCYGTGIYGRVRENSATKTSAYTVYCTCLVRIKEKKDAKEA